MDDRRFDTWTILFATGSLSRRRVLRGLGGSLAGAVVAGGGARQEVAAFICRPPGYLCGVDAHCCSGSCVDYHCACPNGQFLCDGRTCVDCCNDSDCGTGNLCAGHTCVVGQGICPTTLPTACGARVPICGFSADFTISCACFTSTENEPRCGLSVSLSTVPCSSSADCQNQFPDIAAVFCALGGTGCDNLCQAPCPFSFGREG